MALSKSRYSTPVGKMGAGRPSSRPRVSGSRGPKVASKPMAPKSQAKNMASLRKGMSLGLAKRRIGSAMSQMKNRGTKVGRSMAGTANRVKTAQMRRSGRI